MDLPLVEKKTFVKADYSEKLFNPGDYENCIFEHCNFFRADLSGSRFTGCTFRNCHLSGAKLMRTALKDTCFDQCKMQGLAFDQCDHFLFSAEFRKCQMQLCSFYGVKMKTTLFSGCQLGEADFTNADLTASVFDDCDLAGAVFEQTILEQADLRTARFYTLDPEKNRIGKAKFAVSGITGLLMKYDIEIE